ncbi:Uncharacterised protein [Candidatus Bartonella washoeensis]|uniref:Uncharacterized protein n=1 Tax=Candidatus Bartonella washoeensis Sb944nv TaxID=1094563 RepID=J0YSK6_9HYPH|nr:hypothetical protein [Bartonella washoeensis]EJF77813.1 hypothetical protein MCQ_01471 [Bartonella washoeensis Sb944nv]SPU27855.1 Uncharacterised protein [Bartonella washoeensis]
MLSKPFAISEVKDPSQIRVVLYSGDRFVHAPLNGMIDVVKEALQSELEDKIQGLEERIKVLSTELEELKECSF